MIAYGDYDWKTRINRRKGERGKKKRKGI